MEKVISLEFNSAGIKIDEHVDEIRQGDKGVVVEAKFDGINNSNYLARINFTRPDESHVDNILMNPDSLDAEKYTKKLDSLWYFAKSGGSIPATLTVFLVDGQGNQIANGQVEVSVQKTDYSEDPTITPDQYEELLELIASKLNITSGILKASSITELGDLDQYENGQVFYIVNSGVQKLYQLQSGQLTEKFDFHAIKKGKIIDAEVSETLTATTITYVVNLLNEDEEIVASFSVVIPGATTTKAGLMSATDKAKLNNLPTGAEIEETYQTKEDAEEEHDNLQEQIDAIISKSDVVDVVGTHAELEDYDTSKLGNNDIIKVLVDETKNNQRSYYRWLKDDNEFEYVGSEGEFYTKSESDQLFLKKVDAETKYQHKVKVMNTIPTTDDLEENEIAVVPSVENLETIIGNGLKLLTNLTTGAKTLLVDTDIVALKTDIKKLYRHTIKFEHEGENVIIIALSKVSSTPITTLDDFISIEPLNYFNVIDYEADVIGLGELNSEYKNIYVFGMEKDIDLDGTGISCNDTVEEL